MDQKEFEELCDLRTAVEGHAAGLAAMRWTEPQLREACEAGADRLLIDNQVPATVTAWGTLARSLRPAIEIEATGGITLANARDYASAGADYISVGEITHSARAADIALEFD